MLTFDVPTKLTAVSGDFEALRRVIRGLIDNAIKYTPPGGYISISAREIDEMVAISVSDAGQGIPECALPHIFDKFYRAASETMDGTGSPGTAASGVGLGLYLAQHIVGQLNGKLTVESEQGKGTVFTVFLPLWSDDVSTKDSEEDADVKALVSS